MDELTIETKIENMNTVLDFIDERITNCQKCNRLPKVQNQIRIAVDEIFSNIANYAYGFGSGKAKIRITISDNVTIEFEDNGIPYNPLLKNDPDILLPIEKQNGGGLGIYLVKNIMDTVEYRYVNNKNILTIKKHLHL